MTEFGKRPGDMFKDTYDADKDGVIDEGAAPPPHTDHGELDGIGDDDHTQYHTNNRGDARYLQHQHLLHSWCLGDQYKQIINGSWERNHSQDYNWQTKFRNVPPAINNEIEYELFAQAGSRTFEILTKTDPGACIITVYLDDVSQGTIDTWSNPAVVNVYKTLALTVLTTAKHSVKLKAASKNPSSGTYYLYIAWIRIK